MNSPTHEFQRRLSLFDATMIVSGSMVGSGIFIVSADIARDVGSSGWLLFCWAFCGLITIIGALSVAELAGMMPAAGGQYVYLREAYGPLWAFLFGWTNFLIIQTGYIAAVGVAFAKFLGAVAPRLGTDAMLWEATGLGLRIAIPIPWMEHPHVFFERETFGISAGQLVAVGIAVFLTFLNCLGVREGKWVQNIFTVAKIAGLGVLIIAGLTLAANSSAISQNMEYAVRGIADTPRFAEVYEIVPWAPATVLLVLCGAVVGALFSMDAWGNVTFVAAELRDPHRDLPRSLLLGVGLVVVSYLLVNYAYLSALPVRGDSVMGKDVRASLRKIHSLKSERRLEEAAELNREVEGKLDRADAFVRGIAYAKQDRVATAVLERVSPDWGVTLMAAIVMIATFGCINGIVLAGARLNYAMARDGLFFQSVGRLNRRGVPMAGLIYQMIWSIVLIFSGSYNELIAFTIFAVLAFYILTIGAVYVLRRKRPDLPRPYRCFGYPVIPAIYIVLCALIMLGLLIVKPTYSWPSFFIILSGVPIYYFWRRRPMMNDG
jgi:APA family basic amino acid/polyamine antiporter